MPRPIRIDRLAWAVLGVTALALITGYFVKAHCTGAPFDDLGRSPGFAATPGRICYSDIQFLWVGREINNHVFPYLTGWIDGQGHLQGGAIEYPVLSGLLYWLGAIGVHNDEQYLLHMSLILAPFGLLTGWVLAKLSGRTALLWALTPPLAMYAFHNVELPVVAVATVAIGIVIWAHRRGLSPRRPAMLAAAVLAIGFNLKIYPGIFVAPLALYVLTYGTRPAPERRRYDLRGAMGVLGTAAAVAVAGNLPFMIFGYKGWRASLEFQQLRTADLSTNSIWFWGVQHAFGSTEEYDHFVSLASPALIVAAFALTMCLGWRVYKRSGTYPWIGVSAAMLCGFMLFHKVHSPQYVLWLLPFFVLLKIDWRLIAIYLVCDFSLEMTVWSYFQEHADGTSISWWVQWGVWIGVWGRAGLLAAFLFLLPNSALRERYPEASASEEPERAPEPAR
ncbi:hypothetical protein P0W64_21490 [Tsukamurella sp. 8F]|uniref:hypothetical protein n=1 Tax=unclassified Tsukamurella TaxID=2633480 RepID=UPI0023BA21C0|nr:MULTISPECIES: hypothetical protein [unclassified Tsukamurella]MDF0529450.1 hypothetical protein [Tsukamurella sp. 8J]MDF0589359.1 hypothetical protein [Tsukamurella sp. 8F]